LRAGGAILGRELSRARRDLAAPISNSVGDVKTETIHARRSVRRKIRTLDQRGEPFER